MNAEHRRTLWINASIAAVLAGVLVVLVHESVHLVVNLAQGFAVTFYPYGVSADAERPVGVAVLALMAGPIFSLLSGMVMIFVQPFRGGGGFVHLLWLWFAFMSAMEGFGYFTIAGILPAGDTGQTLELLNAPFVVSILSLIFGVAGQFGLAWLFAREAVRHVADLPGLRAFCVTPWLLGTAGLVVFMTLVLVIFPPQMGSEVLVPVIVGTVALPVWAPMAMIFAGRELRRLSPPGSEPLRFGRPLVWVIVTVVIMVVELVLLGPGLHVG